MFEQLLESGAWLASWLAGITLLNYSVGLLIVQEYSRQPFVERDAWRPPGLGGKFGSDTRQLTISTTSVLLVSLLALFADRLIRETLVGGLLVMQMATLASNVADLLAYRALSRPSAAEGHLRYSPEYRYRSAAARIIGISVLTVFVALLFNSLPFLVGSILLLATAGGWYRRARQARQAAQGAQGA